ncbi:hypothetical protein CSA17_04875 [bacterium DOLJORAL78_65_58]|nr:MAG: hypothetical protein CSA17_04875 [bacterium DOLJORAL78_65_58]
MVYGGGGVTPDIEIEQDLMGEFEIAVERDGALFSFAVDYVNDHAGTSENFQVTDAVYGRFKTFLRERENFEKYLEDYDLAWSDSLVSANRDFLERGIRREVARRVAGPVAAYQVAIEADVQLHEALLLFEKYPTLDLLLEAASQWNEEQMKLLAAEAKGEEIQEAGASN